MVEVVHGRAGNGRITLAADALLSNPNPFESGCVALGTLQMFAIMLTSDGNFVGACAALHARSDARPPFCYYPLGIGGV